MWDSSDTTATSPDPAVQEVDAQIVDTQAGGKIVLTPDESFLTDPDTVYPVTIDPTFSASGTADTWVMREGYTSSQSTSLELRAGTYDDGHPPRSHLPGVSWVQRLGRRGHHRGRVLSEKLLLWLLRNGGAIRASRIMQSWDPNTLTWANQLLHRSVTPRLRDPHRSGNQETCAA